MSRPLSSIPLEAGENYCFETQFSVGSRPAYRVGVTCWCAPDSPLKWDFGYRMRVIHFLGEDMHARSGPLSRGFEPGFHLYMVDRLNTAFQDVLFQRFLLLPLLDLPVFIAEPIDEDIAQETIKVVLQ